MNTITIFFEHQEIIFSFGEIITEDNIFAKPDTFSHTSDNICRSGSIQDAFNSVIEDNKYFEVDSESLYDYQIVDLDDKIEPNRTKYVFTGKLSPTEEF